MNFLSSLFNRTPTISKDFQVSQTYPKQFIQGFAVPKEFPRKKETWKLYRSIPLPLDKDGFVESFDINNYDPQKVKEFYNVYGLVVFRDILTEEEVELTVSDLWEDVESLYSEEYEMKVKRDDPQTWNFWGMHNVFGFVNDGPINQLQIWKNRVNPRVYKAFKDIYEISAERKLDEPLITCLDRGSMMRPVDKHPEWKTKDFYHFDIDPWHWTGLNQDSAHPSYNKQYLKFNNIAFMMGEGNYMPYQGYTKLAGVLALSDTNENSGGFAAACGFQNYITKWAQKHPNGKMIEDDKELMNTFQKVFLKKGSLMIFSRELPHNIYPNNSGNFRYAQYLRMMPQSSLLLTPEKKQARNQFIHPYIPKQLERTQICKETLMLD